MGSLQKDLKKRGKKAAEVGPLDPVRALHEAGFQSGWAFAAGFGSIALTFAGWLASRAKPSDDRAQSDRWGLFIGHWAPTFFALGIALKQAERE
jgi:hypothetical protein